MGLWFWGQLQQIGTEDASLSISGVWVHLHVFLPFLQRETTFVTFCLLSWMTRPFKIGSTFKKGAPVAQWVKRRPLDLAVVSLSHAGGKIFSTVNRVPLHTAFHCQSLIILIWLKYCWKGQKSVSHTSIHLLLWEQILSFKSWPPLGREAEMKMAELLCLKVYLFTLNQLKHCHIIFEAISLLRKDVWMTCYLRSFTTIFQSYKDDGRVIMKDCV